MKSRKKDKKDVNDNQTHKKTYKIRQIFSIFKSQLKKSKIKFLNSLIFFLYQNFFTLLYSQIYRNLNRIIFKEKLIGIKKTF